MNKKTSFDEEIVINLNGPFHYLEGERRSLVRSKQVRQAMATFYGYRQVRSVDYRFWERAANNRKNTARLMEKLVSCDL